MEDKWQRKETTIKKKNVSIRIGTSSRSGDPVAIVHLGTDNCGCDRFNGTFTITSRG